VMRRLQSMVAILAVLALAGAACGGDDGGNGAGGAGGDDVEAVEGPVIRIAPQQFAESQTLTEVYAQYLRANGYDVRVLDALGFREVVYPGLRSGGIDMIVDYIGGAQVELAPDAEASADSDEVYANLEEPLAEMDATALEFTPAESRDAILVRADTAEELGLTTISDLAGQAGDLTFGSSSECVSRPSCLPAYTDVYGIDFGRTVTLDYGPPLADGLRAGELDVILYQTTAPEIEQDGFVVLEDDEGVQLAQNITPILRDEILDAYGDSDLVDLLNELTARIETDDLIGWNARTDVEFDDPSQVAADWLRDEGLI
jgi:osmoprotectant transport system substrate-binding protein